MMDKTRRIIITGGAGFIGSNLVDAYLGMGNEIIVLDNFSTGRLQNLDTVADKIQLNVIYLNLGIGKIYFIALIM